MKHYVFSRLLQLIPILFVITFLSFAMMRLAGSDVVLQSMERTGMAASDAVVAAARGIRTRQTVSHTILHLAGEAPPRRHGTQLRFGTSSL